MPRITPTVGRVVWHFNNAEQYRHNRPQAALICCVHSESTINVTYFTEGGIPSNDCSVPLVQDGDAIPEAGPFCMWMPYQIGQAAKTEEALKGKDASQSSQTTPSQAV